MRYQPASPSGRALTSIIAAAAAIAVTLLALAAGARDAQAGVPTFDPGGVKCFEVLETAASCDGDTSPGAVSDLHTRVCIGWNDECSMKDVPVTDSAFGGLIDFIPQQLGFSADEVPVGAIAGRLTQETTLGILNNPCSVTIQVAFTLMNASIDVHNTIEPMPSGEVDVMEPLALDWDGNGLPDGVDRYPSFLNEYFDSSTPPIGRLFGITFVQGYWMAVNVVVFEAGTLISLGDESIIPPLSAGKPAILIFNSPDTPEPPGPVSDSCAPLNSGLILLGHTMDNPCTPDSKSGAACPGTQIFQNRGYPLLPCETRNAFDEDGDGMVNDGCPQVGLNSESGADCDNDINDDFEDADINDGCPEVGDSSEDERIAGSCVDFDEGSCSQVRNPPFAGQVPSMILSASQRDADGDGIENALDVCALDPNPEWQPRDVDPVNDTDIDGIPNICDPDPEAAGDLSPAGCKAGIVGTDEDQDCYSNRQDNCPTVNQLEDPTLPPNELNNLPVPKDSDGDGIGDACDPNPTTADTEGEVILSCLAFTLVVGGAGQPAIGEPTPLNTCLEGVQFKGDVDCSNQINAVDGLRILQHAAEIAQIDGLSEPCGVPMDMDCDNDVDATDARRVLQHVAGLPTTLPAGCPPIGSPLE